MSLLNGIGAAAAAAATPLTKAAVLTRSGTDYDIRAARHRTPRPSRAGQTGAAYDALIRIQGTGLPTEPVQNDLITIDGVTWIIWRLKPSAAGASIMVECMAQPAESVVPQIVGDVDDGGGGSTRQPVDQAPILAKLHGLSVEKALTADSDEAMSRLIMRWPYDAAETDIQPGIRVTARALSYSVQSVGIDDENPEWRRAMLARSE